MTQEEWLACAEPRTMLEFLMDFLPGKVSERLLRLFGCACCRRIWHLLDERSRNDVEHAERVAEGLARLPRTRRDVFSEAEVAVSGTLATHGFDAARVAAENTALMVGFDAALKGMFNDYTPRIVAERAAQSDLLRCIFGNPFRALNAEPAWFTPTVIALAQAIYEERAFDPLPVLADALEEVGCENSDILNHCRQTGEHVRGCWVVDLVLGKE
jgi:hypothetical protein